MQTMNGESAIEPQANVNTNIELPAPFDMLFAMKPMLPLKEQKFVDLMVKICEVQKLMDEINSL